MNEHLSRVSSKIEEHVFSFCLQNAEFHMETMTKWVKDRIIGLAPDSPARILRMLRKKGLVDYEVVSRKDSLYRIRNIQAQGVLF